MKEINPNQTGTSAAKITANALRRHELSTYGEDCESPESGEIESCRRPISTRARRIVMQAQERYSLERLAG